MVFRAKKAQTDSMRKALLEIVLFSIFFLLLIFVLVSLWRNLKGTSLEEQAEMQFNVFVSNLRTMTYTQAEYSLSYSQLLMPADYYLVAFPAASPFVNYSDSDKVFVGEISLFTAFRPEKCSKEPDQTCLCLYNKQPGDEEDDKHKNIVKCEHIDVEMFIANHIYEEKIIMFNSEEYSFSESDAGSFLGARFTKKSGLGAHIRKFIEGSETYAIKDRTQYLGFYDETINDVPLHDLVIKSKKSVPIPLYVELLKTDDNSMLIVFPYSYGLFNRKYFLLKHPGLDSCDNQFLHTVFEVVDEPGNLSYCEQTISGLIESEDRIGFCPQGTLAEMCACGGGTSSFYSRANNKVIFPRAITYGYCAKFGDAEATTVVNLPTNFCEDAAQGIVLTPCSIYEDKYACASDACDTGNLCYWDDTQTPAVCSSSCYEITKCEDYDADSCNSDVCSVSGLGCVWGIENNQEVCTDLCDEITDCSDYNGKFECRDDFCKLYIPPNAVKKCEYDNTNNKCSTISIGPCDSITDCQDYNTKSNCEGDICNLYLNSIWSLGIYLNDPYEKCEYDDTNNKCSTISIT